MKFNLILFTALSISISLNAQMVGIGTSTPDEMLHIVGKLKIEDGSAAAGYLGVSDANGVLTWTDPLTISTMGDNLGNHTATQNIALNGWYLNRDGGANAGISILADGNVGIQHPGLGNATLTLKKESNPSTTSYQLAIVDGDQGVSASITDGEAFFRDNVGIGFSTNIPTADLDVNGTIRIRGGSPDANDILTSEDDLGNATWTRPTGLKMAYAINGNTATFDNTDPYYDVLTAARLNNTFGTADFKLDVSVTARLTGGNSTDEFFMRVKCFCVGTEDEFYSNEISWTPDEDTADHNNFQVVNYLDVVPTECPGGENVDFTLQVKNTGDDAWQIRDISLTVTEY